MSAARVTFQTILASHARLTPFRRRAEEAMCLQVRDALTVGSISLSSHFFSIKMDVKDALKALGNEMRYAVPAFPFCTAML